MQGENLWVSADRVVATALFVQQTRQRQERLIVRRMSGDPLLELGDRAAALTGFQQLEGAILHELARRALAIATYSELGHGVLPGVRLTPRAVRRREPCVV